MKIVRRTFVYIPPPGRDSLASTILVVLAVSGTWFSLRYRSLAPSVTVLPCVSPVVVLGLSIEAEAPGVSASCITACVRYRVRLQV